MSIIIFSLWIFCSLSCGCVTKRMFSDSFIVPTGNKIITDTSQHHKRFIPSINTDTSHKSEKTVSMILGGTFTSDTDGKGDLFVENMHSIIWFCVEAESSQLTHFSDFSLLATVSFLIKKTLSKGDLSCKTGFLPLKAVIVGWRRSHMDLAPGWFQSGNLCPASPQQAWKRWSAAWKRWKRGTAPSWPGSLPDTLAYLSENNAKDKLERI